MNRLTRVVVPAMLLALVGSASNAQPQPSLDLRAEEAAEALDAMAPKNAALVYYQLFMQADPRLIPARHFFEGEEIDQELIDMMGMTTQEAAQVLIESQDYIERYIWATSLPECDFGLQYQDGWGVLLMHLQPLRETCKVLSADAYRLAGEGEFDKAAERFEAIINIGQQIKHDRTLISSLISIAMTTFATNGVRYMVDNGQLTEQGRDTLIARLEALQTDDPFGLLDCLVWEYTVSAGWLAKMPADTHPSEWLAGYDMDADDLKVISRLDAQSRQTLLRDAERMAEYYRRAQQAWGEPDAVEKLDALGVLSGVGAFGETGKIFLAAAGKAKAQDLKGRDAIDETLITLYAYRPPNDPADSTETPEATAPRPIGKGR